MSSFPPEGFEARVLAPEDASAAAELLFAFDSAHLEEVTDRMSEQDVLDWWRIHELEHDSIALASGDSLVAFGLLRARRERALELNGFVHPEYRGGGFGSFLLDWAEGRAPGRAASRLRVEVVPTDGTMRLLVEARGFQRVRSGYRMVIDLETLPARAKCPHGFTVATLREGEERLLYEVVEEAFAEEWGRPHRSFEEWERNIFSQESFDPELCFLVREGDEVVAAETCSQRLGIGWIGSIGVRKPWRRRGLGRALLLHAFAELFERGERRIGLGVDAENPTGATGLYERVGMRVAWQADTYEKAL